LKYLKKIKDLDPFNEEWDDDENVKQIDPYYRLSSIYSLKFTFNYICYNYNQHKKIYFDHLSIKIPDDHYILELDDVDEFIELFYLTKNIEFKNILNKSVRITIMKDKYILYLYPFVTVNEDEKGGVIVLFYEKENNKLLETDCVIITQSLFNENQIFLKRKIKKLFNKFDIIKYINNSIKKEYDFIINQLVGFIN